MGGRAADCRRGQREHPLPERGLTMDAESWSTQDNGLDRSGVLACALELIDAGIPVFPVELVWDDDKQKWFKKPRVKRWPTAATCDEAQVRGWFTASRYL